MTPLSCFERALRTCGYDPVRFAIKTTDSGTELTIRAIIAEDSEFDYRDRAFLGDFQVLATAKRATDLIISKPIDATGDIAEIMNEYEIECEINGVY